MSDALTDIGRDQARTSAAEDYILAVLHHLETTRSPETASAVIASAHLCDHIPRGYWQGSTNFAASAEGTLRGLEVADPLCWARTLPTASALKRMSTHDKGRQRPSPPRGANISRTPSAFGLGPHIFHRKFLALSYGVRGLVGRNFISSQPACRGRT